MRGPTPRLIAAQPHQGPVLKQVRAEQRSETPGQVTSSARLESREHGHGLGGGEHADDGDRAGGGHELVTGRDEVRTASMASSTSSRFKSAAGTRSRVRAARLPNSLRASAPAALSTRALPSASTARCSTTPPPPRRPTAEYSGLGRRAVGSTLRSRRRCPLEWQDRYQNATIMTSAQGMFRCPARHGDSSTTSLSTTTAS